MNVLVSFGILFLSSVFWVSLVLGFCFWSGFFLVWGEGWDGVVMVSWLVLVCFVLEWVGCIGLFLFCRVFYLCREFV